MKVSTHPLQSMLADQIDSAPELHQGLPGVFYSSPDYFDYETATVLRHGWHCLGRADCIPSPGNYFTTKLLNEPLLVVRGDDDEIRVLSNICRHRNMPVAEGSGSRKLFVCSYHAWSYGRDGKLVSAPKMDIHKDNLHDCTLPGFSCEIWRGFIYVNLDAKAEPLAPELESLDQLIENYQTESFRLVHSAEEDWACNWKCLVENFMEGYHLSVVHPRTLRAYTPTELCSKGQSGTLFTSYHANYPDGIPARGSGAPGLDEKQRHRSTLFSVFPTQVVSQSASLLVSLSLQPTAVDKVHVRWTMSVYGDDLSDKVIEERIALWSQVNEEDREKLEKLQSVLGSSHANAGPLADEDFEGTIHDFHKYLAKAR